LHDPIPTVHLLLYLSTYPIVSALLESSNQYCLFWENSESKKRLDSCAGESKGARHIIKRGESGMASIARLRERKSYTNVLLPGSSTLSENLSPCVGGKCGRN
jgi:hypothetical protein